MRPLARAACAGVVAWLLVATAAAAQQLPSDADTPSDSPSAWHSVWPWLLIGIGGFALLLLVAFGVSWRTKRTAERTPAAPPTQRSRP